MHTLAAISRIYLNKNKQLNSHHFTIFKYLQLTSNKFIIPVIKQCYQTIYSSHVFPIGPRQNKNFSIFSDSIIETFLVLCRFKTAVCRCYNVNPRRLNIVQLVNDFVNRKLSSLNSVLGILKTLSVFTDYSFLRRDKHRRRHCWELAVSILQKRFF